MNERYNDYLKTEYWQAVAKAVKARAGYRCQLCNSQHDLCAHHRTYDHRGKELDHLDDLVCLCRRCHEIFHGKVGPELLPVNPPPPRKLKRNRGKGYAYNHAADMPSGVGDIALTKELIKRLRTGAYGFTNATLRALGMKKPLLKGWPDKLVGVVVTRAAYWDALIGRQEYNSGTLET